ncbi:hypothetical protein FFK22_015130 [Mycobacterium sp. KBS0706]|uniref:hypothetical protein n=1 Tax=Mycobacterium sp. KBS0706 TaxID=2578109 RepID=UPI00110F73AA|nr:hypothetical protein [Mycobacterium sp. KBS0706]TSD87797.1 hypothetical protein FFK22_015130 [Mycobacterium sp. KBS0706]
MRPDQIEAITLKLGRSAHHISALQKLILEYKDRKPMVVEYVEWNGHYGVKFVMRPPIPYDFVLTAADALGNLRAVLDYSSHLIFDPNGNYSEDMAFPISKSKTKFEETLKTKKYFRDAQRNALDILTNDVRPYPGGNDILCWLNQVNNMEKHRFPSPMIQSSLLKIGAITNFRISKTVRNIGITAGTKIDIEIGPGARLVDYELDFDIAFGVESPRPYDATPMVYALNEILAETQSTIKKFGLII